MKIQKISALRFKNRSFSHDLQAVNLIVGDSFSGKTAVLDAIVVGLLGFHPDLGKRTVDTGDLFSGPASVTLEYDNSTTQERKWTVEKGKVSDKTIGNADSVVPVALLSLRDWFGLTEQQRVQYIFDRSAAGGNPLDLVEEIETLATKYPAAAVTHIVESVKNSIEAKDNANQKFQDWLNGVIESFKLKAKETKDVLAKKRAVYLSFKLPDTAPKDNSSALDEATRKAFQSKIDLDAVLGAAQKAGERAKLAELVREIEPIEQQIKGLKEKIERGAAVVDYAVQVNALATEINRLTDLMRQIERDRDALGDESEKRQREFLKLMANAECPTCKTEGGTWKKRFEKQHTDAIDGLKSRDAKLREQFNTAAESLAEKHKELKTTKTVAAAQNERVQEIKNAKSDFEALEEKLAKAKEARAKLSGMPEPPKVDADTARKAYQADLDAVTAAQTAQRAFDQWKTDKQRQKDAMNAMNESGAGSEASKEAQEIAENYRQQIVDSVFGNFIATARKLTDGILVGDLEYKDGEIGRVSNGNWVSHRTFSGTEKAITYAGLSVALAQESPIKLVLIDELGIMDAKAKDAVIQRMVKLTEEEVIDQAVFCDVSMPTTSLLRVNVIEIK